MLEYLKCNFSKSVSNIYRRRHDHKTSQQRRIVFVIVHDRRERQKPEAKVVWGILPPPSHLPG